MDEPVKSAPTLNMPLSGEVAAMNGDLETALEQMNQLAYEAWIFRLKSAERSKLMAVLGAEGRQ